MMVNQAGNAIQRHRSGCFAGEIEVCNELIFGCALNGKRSIDVCACFVNPFAGQNRLLAVFVGIVPGVQRGLIVASHCAGYAARFVPIFCPCFLIAECLIVCCVAMISA